MTHRRLMELLKDIEDKQFNDFFFVKAHWLSCRRVFLKYTVFLANSEIFLK
jgi:hypothetical protein